MIGVAVRFVKQGDASIQCFRLRVDDQDAYGIVEDKEIAVVSGRCHRHTMGCDFRMRGPSAHAMSSRCGDNHWRMES
jgi:hypothetical protein